ncbi:MAG: insulinase family protein [Holosporaceae bacterium]|nr:insulinase family protein [Holosporaceae bacterium]
MVLMSLSFASAASYKLATFSLKNGLRVVCLRKKTSPIVSFSIWYRCGSMCDRLGKSGVAHYLEHMVCASAGGEFKDFLEKVGADHNALTSLRSICFYEIVPMEYLETVFGYEARRMAELDMQEKVFLSEKGAILEERRMTHDSSPAGELYEATVANAFNRHIGGISVLGWESEIKDLQLQDLRDFYDEWFAPNNAIILVVGDFPDVEYLKKIAEKHFGAIKEKVQQPPAENGARPSLFKEITLASSKNSSWNVEYIYHVPTTYGNDIRKNIGLELLISVLNQPDFFLRKTMEHHLNIAHSVVLAYLAKYFQFDVVSIDICCSSINNNSENVWNYLRKKLLNIGLTKGDLDVVKSQRQLAFAHKEDNIAHISMHIGQMLSLGYKPEDIQSMDDILQSIRPEECNEILREIFSQEPVLISRSVPKDHDRD